jgi:hypothetical protein
LAGRRFLQNFRATVSGPRGCHLHSAFAVAFAFVTVAHGPRRERLIMAALIWMTNFGIIEKGRLIEIEALRLANRMAFICWLSWWKERRSAWLVWTVLRIFLGLAMLAAPLTSCFSTRS